MSIHYIDNLESGREEIKVLVNLLSETRSPVIYLDTETSGLDFFSDVVLLIQIRIDGEIFILHRGNLGEKFSKNLISKINKSGLICVGHNIKFDAKMLKSDTGIWIERLYDTQTVENVITCGVSETKLPSLAFLVNKYLGIVLEKDTRMEFIGKTHKDTFTEQQIQYSALDVLYLEEIRDKQLLEAKSANLIPTVELEMEVLLEVAKMEYRGVHLDVEYWTDLTAKVEISLRERELALRDFILDSIDKKKYKNALEFAKALSISQDIKTKRVQALLESMTDPETAMGWIKEHFNMGSPYQLKSALLLNGVNVANTNEKTLNKVKDNEVINKILEFRESDKLFSTYGYNIIDLINKKTGRIHTEYFTMGTATGRFSSSNPNMQNLPRTGGYRQGFISRPGFTFISMDYSQQEYRLAGALSKEPRIIQAYVDGWDMHTATAATRFEKDLKDITPEERNYGKTMNFAVLYGTTEYGIKKNFSISRDEATELLNKFFKGYPVLTAFKNAVEDMIVKLGYSITPLGRRRYFKPIPVFCTPKEIEKMEAQMKREGFNMVIQGGGADVTKKAMVLIGKNNPFGDKFSMVLQTHDEIVAEVADDILEEGVQFMKKCMLDAFQPLLGEIPAMVDAKTGKRWGK